MFPHHVYDLRIFHLQKSHLVQKVGGILQSAQCCHMFSPLGLQILNDGKGLFFMVFRAEVSQHPTPSHSKIDDTTPFTVEVFFLCLKIKFSHRWERLVQKVDLIHLPQSSKASFHVVQKNWKPQEPRTNIIQIKTSGLSELSISIKQREYPPLQSRNDPRLHRSLERCIFNLGVAC